MVTNISTEKVAPQRLKMSYEEYLEFANDSEVMEWIDGEVIIYMPPVHKHQAIIGFLHQLLNSFIQFFDLGIIILSPFEVKLWPAGPSREPDIIFVGNENLPNLTTHRFEGGPDLLIEIISPGSVTQDRVHKFTEYQQAGVREYWVIDARPHQQHVDFYLLGSDKRYHPAPLDDEGCYHATLIPNFWFNTHWLWLEKPPNPQLALAEIIISMDNLPDKVKDTYQALYDLLSERG